MLALKKIFCARTKYDGAIIAGVLFAIILVCIIKK